MCWVCGKCPKFSLQIGSKLARIRLIDRAYEFGLYEPKFLSVAGPAAVHHTPPLARASREASVYPLTRGDPQSRCKSPLIRAIY